MKTCFLGTFLKRRFGPNGLKLSKICFISFH